jgi:hypothetical protein
VGEIKGSSQNLATIVRQRFGDDGRADWTQAILRRNSRLEIVLFRTYVLQLLDRHFAASKPLLQKSQDLRNSVSRLTESTIRLAYDSEHPLH